MENLKIRVNSEAERKEVQELFVVLGATCCSGLERNKNVNFLFMNSGFVTACKLQENFDKSKCKEITLAELRDLVVLKRNDVGDATHSVDDGIWDLWVDDEEYKLRDLKPIEKPMKEYLRKNSNGTYSYIGTVRPEHVSDFMIEIPEGCNIITCENRKGNLVYFHWKSLDSDEFFLKDEKIWSNNFDETLFDFIEKNEGDVVIIWSRHTHPEELPFIDDEPLQSLNDQYAEIEKVRQTLNQRQEQYGSFEDVAMITEQMVDVMRKGYYENLAYNQKMALYMICSKMARIVNGNPNHKDSWHDIAGYATLIDNELESEKDMPF